jgi:hypothetical protein
MRCTQTTAGGGGWGRGGAREGRVSARAPLASRPPAASAGPPQHAQAHTRTRTHTRAGPALHTQPSTFRAALPRPFPLPAPWSCGLTSPTRPAMATASCSSWSPEGEGAASTGSSARLMRHCRAEELRRSAGRAGQGGEEVRAVRHGRWGAAGETRALDWPALGSAQRPQACCPLRRASSTGPSASIANVLHLKCAPGPFQLRGSPFTAPQHRSPPLQPPF